MGKKGGHSTGRKQQSERELGGRCVQGTESSLGLQEEERGDVVREEAR